MVDQTEASQAARGAAQGAAIRPPLTSEMDAILRLFESEVRAGQMLPRSADEIRGRLDDWLVITLGGAVAGCVSLVFFNQELCEVRSLAVDPAYRGQGLGGRLIAAALRLAEERGMRRVLTLTRATTIFERHGFKRSHVTHFPEKVWRDCAPCPLRERCDEVALIYPIVRPITHEGNCA
jgi:amino-acid N-acetyltransferase